TIHVSPKATAHTTAPYGMLRVMPSATNTASLEKPWFLQIRCIIIIIIIIQYSDALGGGTETINANGTADFNILQATQTPFSQTLSPTKVSFRGTSPAHGAFTAGIDLSKPTTNTTVR